MSTLFERVQHEISSARLLGQNNGTLSIKDLDLIWQALELIRRGTEMRLVLEEPQAELKGLKDPDARVKTRREYVMSEDEIRSRMRRFIYDLDAYGHPYPF